MKTQRNNHNKGNEYTPYYQRKQRIFLNSETLLKYFLGVDDYIDTLITCRGTQFDLRTCDYYLYEALGSLKEYDDFKLNKLVKLLEVVTVMPFEECKKREKPILTHERVKELRQKVLSGLNKKIKN